jgi:hypothetical protein
MVCCQRSSFHAQIARGGSCTRAESRSGRGSGSGIHSDSLGQNDEQRKFWYTSTWRRSWNGVGKHSEQRVSLSGNQVLRNYQEREIYDRSTSQGCWGSSGSRQRVRTMTGWLPGV